MMSIIYVALILLYIVVWVSYKVGVALDQNKIHLKTIAVDFPLPTFVKIHWVVFILYSYNTLQARNTSVFKWN